MKEKTLLRIALVVGMVGIVALFAMSRNIKADEAMISRLDESVDERVVVTGTVAGVSSGEGVTFIKIQRDEIATVVLFGKAPLVTEGDYVQIRGKVTEKDGEAEIIGEEVRVI